MTDSGRVTLQLQVLGCGDAFSSGGRLHTCFLLQNGTGGGALPPTLLDCGATSLAAMKGRGIEPATIRAILITHLHGDHFGGLPFLLADAHYRARRTEPLTLAGHPVSRSACGRHGRPSTPPPPPVAWPSNWRSSNCASGARRQ